MKKIEEQELKQLQEIQQKSNVIIMKLGELSYSEIILKDQKLKIKNELFQLKEEENTIKEFLISKYGNNLNVNIETGEY